MDDGRLGDEMTLTALARQISALGQDLTEFRTEMRSSLGTLDSKVVQLDSKVVQLDAKVEQLDAKVDHLGGKVAQLDSRVGRLDDPVDGLAARMKMEFEETRRVINLGFENVQMLDEKIDRRFDDTDRAHRDQRTLLEAAVRGLRRDVNARKPAS